MESHRRVTGSSPADTSRTVVSHVITGLTGSQDREASSWLYSCSPAVAMTGDELAQGDVADPRLTHLSESTPGNSHERPLSQQEALHDVSPPITDDSRVEAAAAYVARRRQRQSDNDVWTTDVAVQTTTDDRLNDDSHHVGLTLSPRDVDCCSLYVLRRINGLVSTS